jgi:DNA-binding transcriptional ArsR family regulator
VSPYKNALSAIAHPTRQTILEELRSGPRSVTELAKVVPVSQPAVSQHLGVLQSVKLVTVHRDGNRRIYRLGQEGIEDLRRYVDGFWTDALEQFAAEAKRHAARRKGRK